MFLVIGYNNRLQILDKGVTTYAGPWEYMCEFNTYEEAAQYVEEF